MTQPSKAAFSVEDFEDELSYDFSKYVKGDEGVGVTPEPTTPAVTKYQRTMKAIVKPAFEAAAEADAQPKPSPDAPLTLAQVQMAFGDEQDSVAAQMFEDIMRATAELCSNKPSKSVLNKLPHRLKQHYVGYIAGKFLSGEASAPATKQ